MAAANTPQKETGSTAAKPATTAKSASKADAKADGKGGASSTRSAKGGEKKSTGGK